MKRLRIIFSIVLLFFALPFWRWMDFISWLLPEPGLYAFAFFFWGVLFLVLPTWLLKPRIAPLVVLAFVLIGSVSNYFSGPLSNMATNDPTHNHCGRLTFTGVFYPAFNVLTQAPADDLEARNQLCWVKKMIQRVPDRFHTVAELEAYLKLTQDKLLMPENKFRVSLPMLAMLYFVIYTNHIDPDPSQDIKEVKSILESLHFWIDQYTVEISSRDYSWWDFPHGPFMQFEYGLVEKNWENLVNSIVVQEK